VNQPLTIIPYLIGISALLSVNALDIDIFPLPFLFLLFPFTSWYSLFLIRYYLLRERDDQIFGIGINQFQHLFSTILWMLGLAILAACIGIAYFHTTITSMLFLLAFTVIALLVFQHTIEAKILSEVMKKHSNLQDININEMYREIRKLILTNMMHK
jgi:hypothetical protein